MRDYEEELLDVLPPAGSGPDPRSRPRGHGVGDWGGRSKTISTASPRPCPKPWIALSRLAATRPCRPSGGRLEGPRQLPALRHLGSAEVPLCAEMAVEAPAWFVTAIRAVLSLLQKNGKTIPLTGRPASARVAANALTTTWPIRPATPAEATPAGRRACSMEQ